MILHLLVKLLHVFHSFDRIVINAAKGFRDERNPPTGGTMPNKYSTPCNKKIPGHMPGTRFLFFMG